jgi:hypothetical protein
MPEAKKSDRDFISKDGHDEIVDLGKAIGSRQDADRVAHALLAILCSGPNRRPEDFGWSKDDQGSSTFRIRLEINGHPVPFSSVVDRLYAYWDSDVTRAAKKMLSDKTRGAMNRVLDDIEAIREFMRTKIPEAFADDDDDDRG